MCYQCGNHNCSGGCRQRLPYSNPYTAPFQPRITCLPNKPINPCIECDPCKPTGCLFSMTTDCVNTTKAYKCIGTAANTNLTTVLDKIDSILCKSVPPACKVAISATDTCCDYLGNKFSSNSIIFTTVVNEAGCQTLNLEVIPVNCTGVIYSDFTTHSSSTFPSVPALITSTTSNFTDTPCPSVRVGDRITYRLLGQYTTQTGTSNPTFTVGLYNGSTPLFTRVGSPDNTGGPGDKNGFSIEIQLYVSDVTPGSGKATISAFWKETANSSLGSNPLLISLMKGTQSVLGTEITGIDYSNISLQVIQTAGITLVNPSYNIITLVTIDILKAL